MSKNPIILKLMIILKPYDNIKSHKKPGFHPLSRRYIFWKTQGEGGRGGVESNWPPFPAVLGLNRSSFLLKLFVVGFYNYCMVAFYRELTKKTKDNKRTYMEVQPWSNILVIYCIITLSQFFFLYVRKLWGMYYLNASITISVLIMSCLDLIEKKTKLFCKFTMLQFCSFIPF